MKLAECCTLVTDDQQRVIEMLVRFIETEGLKPDRDSYCFYDCDHRRRHRMAAIEPSDEANTPTTA